MIKSVSCSLSLLMMISPLPDHWLEFSSWNIVAFSCPVSLMTISIFSTSWLWNAILWQVKGNKETSTKKKNCNSGSMVAQTTRSIICALAVEPHCHGKSVTTNSCSGFKILPDTTYQLQFAFLYRNSTDLLRSYLP